MRDTDTEHSSTNALLYKDIKHHRMNMDVLVPVNVCWCRASSQSEEVDLRSNLSAQMCFLDDTGSQQAAQT